MIDLIIKPTEVCNFSCTFCSSNNISKDSKSLSLDTLLPMINEKTNTIIVNGGDPLIMKPEYYMKIIEHLDSINSPAVISFTTNLWDFHLHPEKWVELFKHKRIKIVTSFQYGNERRISANRVFTEEIFKEVFRKFDELVGYKPTFIAVITKENEQYFNKHAELAKELDVGCKINSAFKSGRQSEFYPLAPYYEKLAALFDTDLEPYVKNVSEIRKVLNSEPTECPINRKCYEGIRSVSPDGIVTACGALGDDYYNGREITADLEHRSYYTSALKSECFACPLFNLCNGCFKTILDYKEVYNEEQIEDHCKHMKRTFKDYV